MKVQGVCNVVHCRNSVGEGRGCAEEHMLTYQETGENYIIRCYICAASKRCSSLFFSTQASLPNFNDALATTRTEDGHKWNTKTSITV